MMSSLIFPYSIISLNSIIWRSSNRNVSDFKVSSIANSFGDFNFGSYTKIGTRTSDVSDFDDSLFNLYRFQTNSSIFLARVLFPDPA